MLHHKQVGFIQGMQDWFNIRKSLKITHNTNGLKYEKLYYCINRCKKKIFDKLQHFFMIKTFSKLVIEEDLFHPNKTRTNITLNDGRGMVSHWDQEQGGDIHFHQSSFRNIVLEFLSCVIRQEKEIKCI